MPPSGRRRRRWCGARTLSWLAWPRPPRTRPNACCGTRNVPCARPEPMPVSRRPTAAMIRRWVVGVVGSLGRSPSWPSWWRRPAGLSSRPVSGWPGPHLTVRLGGVAVGVDVDGIKHVLGIWVQTSEGARFWAGVCAELANRGIKDVLIVCCDGLTGFPEAIEATWPNSTIQTCVVHLIRAAMRFVNWKDRKAVAAALKPIYQAADADAARIELEAFQASELGRKNPHTVATFENAWGSVSPRSWRSRRCCA